MENKLLIPENIAEAVKFLKKGGGKIFPFAGGTSLILHPPANVSYMALDNLKLNYIKADKKYLLIGAMATIGELAEFSRKKGYWNGLLYDCCLGIATTPVRNLITAGGNIVGIHPWSALPGVLLLLDGEIVAASKKVYKAKELFSKTPRTALGADLVTEIKIPLLSKNHSGGWKKFSFTETDYPILSVGAIFEKKNNKIQSVSILASGLALLPQRFYNAEKILIGNELNKKNLDATVGSIKKEAKISNDIRVPVEYKREILGTLVCDVLTGIKQVKPLKTLNSLKVKISSVPSVSSVANIEIPVQ